jgi:flagellar motor switch protein FliN/FliY
MSSSPTSSSSSEAQAPPVAASLGHLLDLECPVEIVLGRGSITIGACLNLEPLRVIRLDVPAGEELQIVVGNVPLMRGEVVIVEERAAIRITEIAPAPGMEN